jgi:aryl-alcohol dehydrogenase-like predicted oxidoreductase
MRYKLLGRTGLRVSEVCLGAMIFGDQRGPWGARTPAQFKENLGALEVSLSPEDLERLDTVSRVELVFPHDFAAAALAYGNTFDLIDSHRP